MRNVGEPATLPPRWMPGIREAGARIGKFVRTLGAMPDASGLGWLALGLFVVIVATVVGQIQLNAWNQPFYDALAQRTWLPSDSRLSSSSTSPAASSFSTWRRTGCTRR